MNKNLKKIRKKHKYTIKQMSILLNISKPYYSQIENCKRGLSYDMALKISNIFNMKPDELFYEDHKYILK